MDGCRVKVINSQLSIFTRRLRNVEIDAGSRALGSSHVHWVDGGQSRHDVHESGANAAVELPVPVEMFVANDESVNKDPPWLALGNIALIERDVALLCDIRNPVTVVSQPHLAHARPHGGKPERLPHRRQRPCRP